MMTVLAILNRTETARAVLRAVAELQTIYGGIPITLLRPRPDVEPGFMPTEEIMSPERRAHFEDREDKLTETLRHAAKKVLPYEMMVERRGTVRTVVAAAAKEATVVVAGAAGHTGWSLARDAIEAVLFDAAAPLLLLPNHVVSLHNRIVAVAWEGSTAVAEAVEAAMPMLMSAEHVVVLEAEEGHAKVSRPESLMAALDGRAKQARVARFALAGRDIGTAILDEAAACGAGVLVMGAFTHMRLLERLFGGATHEILEGARIPLLLHH